MILSHAIEQLFPTVIFPDEVLIRDNGDGVDYIAQWNLPDKKPDSATLQQAYDDFVLEQGQKVSDEQTAKLAAIAARTLHESIADKVWTDQDLEDAARGTIDRLDELDLQET